MLKVAKNHSDNGYYRKQRQQQPLIILYLRYCNFLVIIPVHNWYFACMKSYNTWKMSTFIEEGTMTHHNSPRQLDFHSHRCRCSAWAGGDTHSGCRRGNIQEGMILTLLRCWVLSAKWEIIQKSRQKKKTQKITTTTTSEQRLCCRRPCKLLWWTTHKHCLSIG